MNHLAMSELRAHYQKEQNRRWSRLLVGKRGVIEIKVRTTSVVEKSDAEKHTIVHYISTPRIDYVLDIMNPFGADTRALDKNRGVFWNHGWGEPGRAGVPIGRNLWTKSTKDGVLVATQFAVGITKDDFAGDLFRLTQEGFINSWSIGFFPGEYKIAPLKDVLAEIGDKYSVANASEYDPAGEVIWHKTWDMHEYSEVGVPMNQDAVNTNGIHEAMAKGLIVSDFGLQTFGELAGGRPSNGDVTLEVDQIPTEDEKSDMENFYDRARARLRQPKIGAGTKTQGANPEDTIRWNRTLGAEFDIRSEEIKPSSLVFELASKYLGVRVADIHQSGERVPSARMGSWLSAHRQAIAEYCEDDVRNVQSHTDTEEPPLYRGIQLNSRRHDEFLVEGLRFMEAPDKRKIVIGYQPTWLGLYVTVFSKLETGESLGNATLGATWKLMAHHNYLKGEAFSLSGEFIERGSLTWDEVFLEDANKAALQKAVDRLNAKGVLAAKRGVIAMGPPGTGKTLSGRVMMHQVKDATFIWVSVRDLYYSGGFGGLSYAFDLARENAPSVLFMEDIDSYIDSSNIDLMKIEMDGLAQSAGILTFLTTNFPERFPKALIDRPGRFHDVLKFGLPNPEIRSKMFAQWIPEINDPEEARGLVELTDGMSGAHIWALCADARSEAEEDQIEILEAAMDAIEKVRTQRDTIDRIQTAGSSYSGWKSARSRGKVQLSSLTVTERRAASDAEEIVTRLDAVARSLGTLTAQLAEFKTTGDQLEGISAKLDQVLSLIADALVIDADESDTDKSLKHDLVREPEPVGGSPRTVDLTKRIRDAAAGAGRRARGINS